MKRIGLLVASTMLFGWGHVVSAGPNQSQTQQQAKRGAGNQQWLVNEVRHQLVLLPYYSVFDNLEYKVENYKVTLMGQVTRPSLKDDAGNAVKGIEGVEGVDNQIQVLPPSPMDDQLRRAEFQAIYSWLRCRNTAAWR